MTFAFNCIMVGTMTTMPNFDDVLSALRGSSSDLARIADKLDADAIRQPSYASEWSIAQVYSHIGSGAEIGLATVRAALGEGPPPDNEAIWDRWNEYSPEQMVSESVAADQRYVAFAEAVSPATRESLSVDSYMGPIDLATWLTLRLHEHALHAWDVRVALDPTATLRADAVPILLDGPLLMIGGAMARGDKPAQGRLGIDVGDPERHLLLSIDDGVELAAVEGDPADRTSRLVIPAEALLRLTAGRLDSDHTPDSVRSEGTPTLDDLRRLFPGY